MALSRQVKDILLANEIKKAEGFAAVYTDLAKLIAAAVQDQTAFMEKAREVKASTWDMFKRAMSLATAVGHSPQALRMGMEIACDQAGVPGGSFRSYVNTIVNLYEDIQAGELTLAQAEAMTITAARALYRVVTPVQEARAQLAEVTKGWTAEELTALLHLAKGEAEPEEVEEVVKVALVHAAELHEQDRRAA